MGHGERISREGADSVDSVYVMYVLTANVVLIFKQPIIFMLSDVARLLFY